MRIGNVVLLVLLLSAYGAHAQSAVDVNIRKIRNGKGVCCVVLFADAVAFPGAYTKAVASKVVRARAGEEKVRFEKIPAGTYAIAVIHDENEDGKLNTNFIGIPTEGYGASNNRLPLASAPKFSMSSFTVTGKDKSVDIDLKYFGRL